MYPVIRTSDCSPWRSSSYPAGTASAAAAANPVAAPRRPTNAWVRAMTIASSARAAGSVRFA